jgi:hypothetical protein
MSVPFGHVRRKVRESIMRPLTSCRMPAAMLNRLRYAKDIGDFDMISCLSV